MKYIILDGQHCILGAEERPRTWCRMISSAVGINFAGVLETCSAWLWWRLLWLVQELYNDNDTQCRRNTPQAHVPRVGAAGSPRSPRPGMMSKKRSEAEEWAGKRDVGVRS